MQTDRRKTHWYIEINDGDTNERAMAHLTKTCVAPPDKFERLKEASGLPHNLLRVERSFINILDKNQGKFKFFYTIFTRREGEYCVRRWEFPFKGVVRRTKKFKKAKDWAAKLPKKK